MSRTFKPSTLSFISAILLSILAKPLFAIEFQYLIEDKQYARVLGDANGLFITDDGVVYVTSEEKGTLLKIVEGKVETLRLSPGIFKKSDISGIGQLSNGNLVIANEATDQIGIIDSDYSLLNLFSKSGDDPGELDDPGPLAVSVNNNIYVGDVGNKQITVFNHQGLFLHSFGHHGYGGKDLLKPTHISLDADENVYVLEGRQRVSIFDLHGNLIDRFSAIDLKQQFGKTPEFSAMTTDANGILYLADAVESQIVLLDWRKREVLQRFGSLGQSRAQYRNISQLSVNNRGQIAILDKKNRKVEVFQLDQIEYKKPVASDRLQFDAVSDSACRSIHAFSDERMLCIKAKGQGIVILSAEGEEQGAFAAEIKNPTTLHSDSNHVAILEGNKLHVYTRDGKRLFDVGRFGISAGGFQKPADVFVFDSQYYVSDTGNNRVQVFSSDGQFLEQIRAQQDGNQLFSKVGPLAVDSKQQLYIADQGGSGLVRVISKDRQLVASIGREDKSIHKVTKFHALDIDGQDRLYVLAGSRFNDYSVRIYQDFMPYMSFGGAGKNGTDYYFSTVGSMSVASGDKNIIHINDTRLKKHFRFDLLEIPDPAFGLKIGGDKSQIRLEWSSSESPLIAAYEIQGAAQQEGPFITIMSTTALSETMPVSKAEGYTWFRVVSVSGHDLRANPSFARENKFQGIFQAHAAGHYEEAVKLAGKLLRIDPDNADAHDLLGMSLYQLEDYAGAIRVYKLLEQDENYSNKAISYQVQAYYRLEQYLDARALIDEVLAMEPAEIEPYLICTQLSLELGDAIGAVTCAEDGLALHGNHAELRYLLGRGYIEAGLVDEGLMAYQSVIENNPDALAIRLKIADDLYAMKDYSQALTHYEAILAMQTDSSAAAVGKASSLINLDRDDEAKAIAVSLSGKKETRGDGYYLLGKIAARQGKHKVAVLRLTRAAKVRPEMVDTWLSLAQAYVNIAQLPQSVKSLQQGIEHNPEAYELFELAGKIELERERYPEANGFLGRAVELQPQSLLAQNLYARGLFTTRNYRSAAIHAELAATIAPRDIDVLTLQADIANQQGKTGSAIEFLKTAINIDPVSADLHYRAGRVYQDANLFDASREHLEKATSINPVWASPHIALGNLFIKRRLFDDAISAFENAIELDPSNENRAILNVAFAERKKSLEFEHNAPQLVLSDLNLQTVFSAAYKKYLDQPIGSVKLENVGATDYGNLKLSFQIKEYMDFPSIVDIEIIKGNDQQEIDIRATFNNRILEIDGDTGVQVEVKLSYLRDGRRDDIILTQPMTIYGKNAIVWGDSAMIGSFVTPHDDALHDYVRRVVNEYQPDPGPLNGKLVSAMAYFSSLTALGINYIIDPNTPFTELRDDQIDYVQFPRETLRLKSGDCDDLSVLISAGLENLGIRTAFVEVPGHLFMMFDTGIPSDDAGLISRDDSLLALKDGNVWIPLEATMVNTSFIEAWAEGARKYQLALAENNLGIIDLREAWEQYQPVTLSKASYSLTLPEEKRTRSLVQQTHKVLLAKSIDRLVMPYQAMVTNNPKNIAARLQIAILYARFRLYEDAEIAFEVLDELAPENSAVQTNQGNLYFLQEDYQRAIDNYSRAASLDSEDGGILINLSMAQFKAGNLKQAASSFQQATQLSPALKQEYEAYGKLLSQ